MSAGPDNVRLVPGQAAFIALDARGVATAWSGGARELLGYRSEDVLGKRVAGFLSGPLPAEYRRCWAEGVPWSGSVAVRHQDGRTLRVRLEAHPLLKAIGETDWLLTVTAVERTATGPVATGEPDLSRLKQWALEQLPLPMALFDREGLCLAVNAATTRVMGMPERDLLGIRIGHTAPAQPMKGLEHIGEVAEQVWRRGEPTQVEAHLRTPGETHPHAWLLSLYPVKDREGRVCALSQAAADTTEQFRARQRLSVLNEAGLRIGTTLDVTRTAQELAQVATEHFADFVAVDLIESLVVTEPGTPPAGDRSSLRRTAQHSVVPGCPEAVVALRQVHSYHEQSPPGRALATGRASRHHVDDTTLGSWAVGSPDRARSIRTHGIHSLMVAPLSARGVTLGVAVFCRHRTAEAFDDEDLRLAEELAARAAVYIDNARRYTRERDIALALQAGLLPEHVVHQAAVEVACRYLPADPDVGIGGDWYDVIPLSGARVALVVGDVVGRGIQASATMGRLCTAVRTLADVDLAPDELLTQLDDLVLRMDRGDPADGTSQAPVDGQGEVGATCLYAVYDPVSRRCTMARAGHPAPVLVMPDGTTDFLSLPAGPPLGLGGLPFETAEFDVPEGSVLALYTNGVIDGANRDVDEGRAVLRTALADSTRPLEDTCDSTLKALLPGVRTDDAALLLARTRALGGDQVADWDLPSDPAVVARTRELVSGALADWHLEDLVFVAELIVSELVTNAIRYGHPPVQLRLIRDTTLICEVSDAGSTAPHLRRARTFDEGGRGLFIVAQLAQRWGSRHTRVGKTIWAEVPLVNEGF